MIICHNNFCHRRRTDDSSCFIQCTYSLYTHFFLFSLPRFYALNWNGSFFYDLLKHLIFWLKLSNVQLSDNSFFLCYFKRYDIARRKKNTHQKNQNKTTNFRAADMFDYFHRRKLCDSECVYKYMSIIHTNTVSCLRLCVSHTCLCDIVRLRLRIPLALRHRIRTGEEKSQCARVRENIEMLRIIHTHIRFACVNRNETKTKQTWTWIECGTEICTWYIAIFIGSFNESAIYCVAQSTLLSN